MIEDKYLEILAQVMKDIAEGVVRESSLFDIGVAIIEQVLPDGTIRVFINNVSYAAKSITPTILKKNDSVVLLSFTTGNRQRYILGKANAKVNMSKDDIINALGYTPADATQSGDVVDKVYPVGSIYMSVNSVNPSTLFGGTWVSWGSGKVPVGVNASDSEFNTVEKSGGSKYHTLSTSEMPSHGHGGSCDSTSMSTDSSGTTYTGTSGTLYTDSTTATNSSSSTLYTSSDGGETITGGSHGHNVYYMNDNTTGGSSRRLGTSSTNTGSATNNLDGGSHSHYVSNHSHSISPHNHSQSPHSHAISSHSHSVPSHYHSISSHSHSLSIYSAGGGSSHNNLQPYITCYMWKRTA